MNKAKFISFASVISEIQQSDVFMTVKARILETPKANLNGASVTDEFVNDIIANEQKYVGLPLYADVHALKSGKYNRLGHLYDSKTGEFHSTQIGSFYQFEKEEFEGGAYLVGYARIPKRDKALSKAIAELFADGALKFSFEIACIDYEEKEDGTIQIDASENNYLEGTAIVTFPACEDAVALEFVAQREADDTRKGDEEMAEVEKLETEQTLVAEETEATETSAEEVQTEVEQAEVETAEKGKAVETAESEKAEESEEVASEDENAACKKEKSEEEEASCKKERSEEVATVYVHEGHVEEHSVCMYDSETGKDVCQSVRVETHVSEPVEGELVETDDGAAIAETVVAAGDGDPDPGETPANPETPETPATPETPETPEVPETPAAPVVAQPTETVEDAPILPGEGKKTAEQMIAELAAVVESLKNEIAELKEQKVTAEAKTVTAEINPFMDSIQSTGTYSLLQKENKQVNSYTLLGKA